MKPRQRVEILGALFFFQGEFDTVEGGYVEIPRETKSSTEDSVTSQSRSLSHYRQNAYADVIAPAVFAKMVAVGVI